MPVFAGTSNCAPTRYQQPTVRDEDEEMRLEAGVSLDEWNDYKADHKTQDTVETNVEMVFDTAEAVTDDSSQTSESSFTSATTADDAECLSPATTVSSGWADSFYAGKKRKRSPSGGFDSTDELHLIDEVSIDMEAIVEADSSSSPQIDDSERRGIYMYVDETGQLHEILPPRDDSRYVTTNVASASQQSGGHGCDPLAGSVVFPKTTSDSRATSHSQHDSYATWEEPAMSATIPAINSAGTIFYVALDGTLFDHLAPRSQ